MNKERSDLQDPEEDQANEEREDLGARLDYQEPRGPKEIQVFQACQDRLGTEGRKETEEQSDLMDHKESRALREKRGRPETEETWAMKVNKEKRDRPVRLERPGTKALKEAEGSRGRRVNRDRRDPEGCRATWEYQDFPELRDPREKHPQMSTSSKSAGG